MNGIYNLGLEKFLSSLGMRGFVGVWRPLNCGNRPVSNRNHFLFDVHFVDLENFQPLARFKVQKFAEVTKFASVTPLRPRQQEVSVSIV